MKALLSPAGARVVTLMDFVFAAMRVLLSPAGARVVTRISNSRLHGIRSLLSPAGARVVTYLPFLKRIDITLLSPAGARVVTAYAVHAPFPTRSCCPPQGRELLLCQRRQCEKNCRCCPPQGRELLRIFQAAVVLRENVAVPRRGASCYGKNAKNTMRIFGIPTIFLYYLLYFCVSIRDIVSFLWCEPACNNLIYCYYNTRFAPNQPLLHILCQPVSKPSRLKSAQWMRLRHHRPRKNKHGGRSLSYGYAPYVMDNRS